MKNYSELKAQALKLPHLPGVYQYKNQAGDIIYIGKAKDLHKRVNSYFKNNSDLKTSLLLDQIATIEYSVTPTEIDALTLEDQLIRAYQPRYNILLKTDSSYRYICLSKTNPPKITTNRKPVKNLYCFGPFPFATNQIVTIARDILGLTKYQQLAAPNWELYLDAANFSKNKPANFLNEKVYQNFIDQLIKTIKHGDQKLILDYQNKMAEHAKKLEFEQALQYKQKIELLNKFTQRTSDLNQKKNSNQQLIIVIEQQNKACIFIFNIQHGLLHAVQNFKFDLRQNNLQDILEAFLKQYYANHLPPAEILLHIQIPKLINNLQIDLAISDYLTNLWQKNIIIKLVDKHKLLPLALQNIYAKLNLKNNLNQELQNLLALANPPKTIDFIDISNLSDQIMVGGAIRFYHGEPIKKLWRYYTIKTTNTQDDYTSIYETVTRRYGKIPVPDVLIIDGGLGQLNAALKALPKNHEICVAALAKQYETLIFSNHTSTILSTNNLAGKFIIKGRDAVHNFVVSYTRQAFKKVYKKSELDQIFGIGQSTKLKLLNHFKSIAQIKKARAADLEKIVGKHKTQILINHFKIDN